MTTSVLTLSDERVGSGGDDIKLTTLASLFKGRMGSIMDESSKLLEDITIPQQHLPTSYRKLSLDLSLVDKVVDPATSLIGPTLSLKSEEQVVRPTLPLEREVKVVNSNSFMVDPTLPLKSEVKIVESMSSPPDPTLS